MINIWCEGDPKLDYTACHLGTVKGTSLLEACEELASRNPYFDANFDRKTLKYKNCALFSSEEEARASHG